MILEDGLAALGHLGPALKGRVAATFVNQAGAMEAGIDAGGLFKELLTDLCAAVLDPHRGLFTATPEGLLHPAPQARRRPPAPHAGSIHRMLHRIHRIALVRSLGLRVTLRSA